MTQLANSQQIQFDDDFHERANLTIDRNRGFIELKPDKGAIALKTKLRKGGRVKTLKQSQSVVAHDRAQAAGAYE